MKYLVSFLILAFAVQTSIAQDQQKWTLQECLERALDKNIQIKQAELDVEAAQIDKKDAWGALLPSLNGQISNTWNTGLTQNITTGILQSQVTRNVSAGATSSINLFDGLRNYKQIQRAKIAKLAAQYSLGKMKDDVSLMVANNFLQIILNKENLKVFKTQNELTLEQIDRTRELVDGGVLPKGDLLEVQAQNATEIQNIVDAQNQVQISLISLAQTLLIEDYKNFDVAEADYEIAGEEILLNSPYEIIDQAKEKRYEIKIAEENKKLAEKDIEIARGASLPTLSAFINYNTRESSAGRFTNSRIDPDQPTREIGFVESTEQVVVAPNTINTLGNPLPFFEQLYLNDGINYGFQLSVPLFNGFQTRNQINRSKVNVRRADFNLEQAQLDLESNVYQAYVDVQGSLKAYEAAEAAAESQELAFEYAQERYDVGLTNAFDLSQSKQRYDNARIDLNRTKYDYIFRLKVLELYFGVPATELKF
ncbi:TolC family protein [Flavimarina sp. Hel_I_48]|uniref:TolC family protein n=1 Tax=Flavimarina sp. Hel_I_48 TaxID=1392488 RepID=UPI0004DF40C9|nr:TolC family protein [Flavimarina sp. Hel_I_48]